MESTTPISDAGTQPQAAQAPAPPTKKLTNKQKLFVEYYLIEPNGAKAARLAGYKGDDSALASIAYENLNKPHIAALLNQKVEAAGMTATEVLAELTKLAKGDYFIMKNDKVKCLELLGKHHKLFTERRELTGAGGGPIAVRVILPKVQEEDLEEKED